MKTPAPPNPGNAGTKCWILNGTTVGGVLDDICFFGIQTGKFLFSVLASLDWWYMN